MRDKAQTTVRTTAQQQRTGEGRWESMRHGPLGGDPLGEGARGGGKGD